MLIYYDVDNYYHLIILLAEALTLESQKSHQYVNQCIFLLQLIVIDNLCFPQNLPSLGSTIRNTYLKTLFQYFSLSKKPFSPVI